MAKKLKRKKKGHDILLRRRLYVTLILIVLAGLATAGVFLFARGAKADVSYDPYFTLSTGPAKVRIFQPLNKSVDNDGTFTASGIAPPNTTIAVKIDGVSKATATSNASGKWNTTVSGVTDGDHTISASTTLNGPFSVVAASAFIPGYSVVDLSTNAMVASSNTGLGTAVYAILNQGAGSPTANAAVKVGSNYIYLVRQRSVTIYNVATQQPVKTIFLANQFLSEGENPSDTGEVFKRAVVSADGSKVYLLYSGDTSGKILAIDAASQTLVSDGGFPISVVAGATGMVPAADDTRLYVAAYNSTEVDVVDVTNGSVGLLTLAASVRDITVSPNGGTVFISKSIQDTNYYVATIDVGTGNLDEVTYDLGTSVEGSTLYAPNDSDLYVAGAYDTSLRVYDTTTHTLDSSITLGSTVLPQTTLTTQSEAGDKLYFPLEDSSVAIVDTASQSVTASILPPASNYANVHGLMYSDGSVYITYDRTPDLAADFLGGAGDYSSLYQSLAVASGAITSNTAATPITVNGLSSGYISEPVSTSPIQLSNSATFSVGDPITITSPSSGGALDTSTPVITGTGPKNKTIQLTIDSGTPINVSVDGSGNWQKQITLGKNKTSTIKATYNNKRTQLVLPNTYSFGGNLAKSQLSIIDAESGFEQNPINLPDFSLTNIKINTSSAINPNGNNYYVINTDLSGLLTDYVQPLLSGDTSNQPTDAISVLSDIASRDLGGIDVYNAQTRQLSTRIQLPSGMIPVSMVTSPDGKKGMAAVFSMSQEVDILQNYQSGQDADVPLQFVRLNLENNTVIGEPIGFTFRIPGAPDDPPDTLAALISSAIAVLSRPGSYNSDGSVFYTSSFSIGKVGQINTDTGEKSLITLPGLGDLAPITSVVVNPKTNVLYVSYLDIALDPDAGLTGIASHLALFDLNNNQLIGDSTLPNLPLLGMVVNSSGTKAYMMGIDAAAFVDAVSVTTANPQAVLVETLPQFQLGIYDFTTGTYQTRDITNTEIPFNMVLSPDDSMVYMPTLMQNVIHTYDTVNDVVDGGNAPILLDGISTAIATTSNIASVSLGTYTDSASYYVPADAPVTTAPTTETAELTGTTVYRFLPSSGSSSNLLAGQTLSTPNQAVQVIRDTAQETFGKQQGEGQGITVKTWLVYILYGTFVSVLGVTGFAAWKTNMLLGGITEEDYV